MKPDRRGRSKRSAWTGVVLLGEAHLQELIREYIAHYHVEPVVSKNSADGYSDSSIVSQTNLRSRSMIEPKQSAETLGAFDGERSDLGEGGDEVFDSYRLRLELGYFFQESVRLSKWTLRS